MRYAGEVKYHFDITQQQVIRGRLCQIDCHGGRTIRQRGPCAADSHDFDALANQLLAKRATNEACRSGYKASHVMQSLPL